MHSSNANAPVQMKIILKDEIRVYQHPRRLPVCENREYHPTTYFRIRIAGKFGVPEKRKEGTVL